MKDIGVAFFHHGHSGGSVIFFDLSAPPSDYYICDIALSIDTKKIKGRVQNRAY
jgi:hypothetical protein